jgi:hypothetical protein
MRIARSSFSLESSSAQSARVSYRGFADALAHHLCAAMGQFYIKAQLSVKRERSNAKVIHWFMCCFSQVAKALYQAPVLAAVNGAFAGLTSIRAFSAQSMFTEQSSEKIDEYTRITVSFWNLNR